jgi:hypothetical protein
MTVLPMTKTIYQEIFAVSVVVVVDDTVSTPSLLQDMDFHREPNNTIGSPIGATMMRTITMVMNQNVVRMRRTMPRMRRIVVVELELRVQGQFINGNLKISIPLLSTRQGH